MMRLGLHAIPLPVQNTNKALPSLGGTQSQNVMDDNDFADFQIAPSTPAANTATAPATTTQAANPAAGQKMNLMEMLNSTPAAAAAAAPAQNRSQSLGMRSMPMQGQFGGMGGMGGVQMRGTGWSMGDMGGSGGNFDDFVVYRFGKCQVGDAVVYEHDGWWCWEEYEGFGEGEGD
ncbi:hypothetical protein D9758_014167 [Tetrapyrgos nigripes]|uniref:Uncharacterized protein n=1 Tax=Tetrapyrgos nigripes TaxID=182062 RepID=A0A8H5CLY2_9AGAR|nr:hypothetical protein D9758_014167 [Tetrapyrgos nigripes]